MEASARDRRLSLTTSALRIFDLSFGEMLWSRRSLFLAVVTGGGVVLAMAIRVAASIYPSALPRVTAGEPALFGMIVSLLYIRFVVPVLGVFYGTALIADEVDDRTITYLFVRPIHRRAVVFGKYLAYLVCTLLLVLPSVVLVFFLTVPMDVRGIGGAFPSLLAHLGALAAGLAAYGALFALVGALLKRPLAVGLVFAFGWESVAMLLPGYLKQMTVVYYLQGVMPPALTPAFGGLLVESPPLAMSLGVLAAITAGALWLAGAAVEGREYVLEQ